MATLALFWALSGAIGLARLSAAAATLTAIGWSDALAQSSVAFWAAVDLVVAGAILYRPWARRACWGMVAVSLIYLACATVLTPSLWADPLGPLVKTLPALLLAALTPTLLEAR